MRGKELMTLCIGCDPIRRPRRIKVNIAQFVFNHNNVCDCWTVCDINQSQYSICGIDQKINMELDFVN